MRCEPSLQGTQMLGRFKGQIGSAPLPGSTLVLDRPSGARPRARNSKPMGDCVLWCTKVAQHDPCGRLVSAGQLVECTPALCPHATWTNVTTDPPGSPPRLVNRASYSGSNSVLSMVNAYSAAIRQAATYTAMAWPAPADRSFLVRAWGRARRERGREHVWHAFGHLGGRRARSPRVVNEWNSAATACAAG